MDPTTMHRAILPGIYKFTVPFKLIKKHIAIYSNKQ